MQEEYKKQLALSTQDGSRQVDEHLSLTTWSGVIGGKKKGSRLTPDAEDPEDDCPYPIYGEEEEDEDEDEEEQEV
ncbi:hypothetical protein TSUD_394660 [Trifolium subterraneum]|uniref:Uncharacterized protein n=1 Tax=Trifolium subterraneum TaxID=3900 RepID=A0A2Z6NFM1_TRISU|nr:hypothetical protein TSUD_394660 [Trifolium subterraneum]